MATKYKNMSDLLKLIPEEKQLIAKKLITELNFMSSTLTQLRKMIKDQGAVELFKNGKQEMLRESPALKSYNTTIQRYSLLYKQLIDLLPKEERKAEEVNPIYDFIRNE